MIFGSEWCTRSGQRPGKGVPLYSHLGPLFPASSSRNSFNLTGRGQPLGECTSCRQSKSTGFHPSVTHWTIIKRDDKENLGDPGGQLELSPGPRCNRLKSSDLSASVCGYKLVTRLYGCSMTGKAIRYVHCGRKC